MSREQISMICPADEEDIEAVLAAKFELIDGVYVNDRLELERSKQEKRMEASQANGRKGGRPKKPSSKANENLQVNSRLAKTKPRKNPSDSDSDSDSDSVSDSSSKNILTPAGADANAAEAILPAGLEDTPQVRLLISEWVASVWRKHDEVFGTLEIQDKLKLTFEKCTGFAQQQDMSAMHVFTSVMTAAKASGWKWPHVDKKYIPTQQHAPENGGLKYPIEEPAQ